MVVTTVEKLEPLPLRKEWMNDLAHAVAFLESLNLAHGDLRPENILLDRNRIKLSDFDCTAPMGACHEACMAPYGRLLNSSEAEHGSRGSSGFLGPRTEQFALGSLYYLINYGFEVYGDRCLTEDPYDHGPKTVELLQNLVFPSLDGDPAIDKIIDKCWHNKYATVSDLAAETKALLDENPDNEATATELDNGNSRDDEDQHLFEGNFISKKDFCQDLEKRGLLDLLSSGEPEQLGFTLAWYRHCLPDVPSNKASGAISGGAHQAQS